MSKNSDSLLARILVKAKLPQDAIDRCLKLCQDSQLTDETGKVVTVDELRELGLPLPVAAYISKECEKGKLVLMTRISQHFFTCVLDIDFNVPLYYL